MEIERVYYNTHQMAKEIGATSAKIKKWHKAFKLITATTSKLSPLYIEKHIPFFRGIKNLSYFMHIDGLKQAVRTRQLVTFGNIEVLLPHVNRFAI